MRGLALYAYNAAFWPYMMGSSAAAFVPALGIWAATRSDPQKTLLRRFTEEWGAHYLERAPFASVTVEGKENIAPEGEPAIYVANHSSMVDILAIFSARLPALWVSKVENFYAPVLGWNMWLNDYIPVRRKNLPSIMRMVRACLSKLASGRSLIVFPEGTRSEEGDLGSFHRGAFFLARRANVPIIPLCLVGTSDVLRKGSMLIRPSDVRVRILSKMHPDKYGMNDRSLRDAVRERMKSELDGMAAPTRKGDGGD